MKTFKTVSLPHIRFTVHFFDLSQLQGIEIKGSGYTCVMKPDEACVFLDDIENTVKNITLAPWIAHELVHVLQIICEHINADFTNEQEHMAYIMHYLYSELLSA